MNGNTRRRRLLLRISKQGPINRREPLIDVLDDEGMVTHSRFNRRVDYVRRAIIYADGNGSVKYRRRWLKQVELMGRKEVDHALSDCCGWGNEEVYHEPYEFAAGFPPPRPLNLPDPENDDDGDERNEK